MTLLVLLDDDARVRGAIARELRRHGVDVRAPDFFAQGVVDTNAIKAAFEKRPDVALIDPVWAGANSLDAISAALEGFDWGGAKVPAYLLSGYRGIDEDSQALFQAWSKQLSARLDFIDIVSKPITTARLLKLLPSNGNLPSPEVKIDIRKLELLPARVLDGARAPVISNNAWSWGLNEPNPGDESAGQRGRHFLVPVRQEDANYKPRLVRYRIEETKLGDGRSLQLAHPISAPRRARKKQAFLEDLFASLCEIGFTRMRYYERRRVPKTPKKIINQPALLHWFPKDAYGMLAEKNQDEPLIAPFGQTLIEHFSQFDTDGLHEMLAWGFSGGDDLGERGSYFSTLTDTNNDNVRARVPILRRTDDHKTMYYAEALLVLDRQGDRRPNVSEEDMKWAAAPLLGACEELRRLLEGERQRYLSKTADDIRKAYQALHVSLETAPEKFAQGFLELACELTEAHDGVLFWSAHPDHLPQLLAVKADPKHFRPSMNLGDHVSKTHHPAAWRAWQTRSEVFLPEFEAPNREGKNQAQSRIGVPLRVGDKLFGCLALMHARPQHFWLRRVNALRHLVEYFSYPLHFAVDRHDRRDWEAVLVHEMRTNLTGIRDWLDEVIETHPALATANGLKATSSLVKRGLDTAQAFLDLRNPTLLSGKMDVFDPNMAVSDEAADFEPMAAARGNRFEHQRAEAHARLRSVESAFRMILRILMHNAIQHGDLNHPILIDRSVCDGLWVLRIVNHGRITADAEANKFTAYYRPRGRRRSGAHIGLAAARKWALAAGADLRVSNCANGTQVESILIWPTWNQKKSAR